MKSFNLPISTFTAREIEFLAKYYNKSKRAYMTESIEKHIHQTTIRLLAQKAIRESKELLESLKDK